MWEKWNTPVRISSPQETSKYGMPESPSRNICWRVLAYCSTCTQDECKMKTEKDMLKKNGDSRTLNWLMKCGWEPAEWTVFVILISLKTKVCSIYDFSHRFLHTCEESVFLYQENAGEWQLMISSWRKCRFLGTRLSLHSDEKESKPPLVLCTA